MRDAAADVVHHFADLAVDTRLADIPADAVDATKKSILDTLGVSLGASGLEPIVTPVLELVRTTAAAPRRRSSPPTSPCRPASRPSPTAPSRTASTTMT